MAGLLRLPLPLPLNLTLLMGGAPSPRRACCGRAYLGLTRVAFREHDSLRGSIQGGEKFWNEPAFDGASFTG